MAKKIKKAIIQELPKQPAMVQSDPANVIPEQPFWATFRFQALLLGAIAFLFYCNTFSHEYAFDDTMAIFDNEYVQQGVGGMHDILTRDAYQSYLEQKNGSNQLAGGRYRPLSLLTFALEQQFMGTNHEQETGNQKEQRIAEEMHVRHVINVLLYMLSVVVLLYFFRQVIFPAYPLAAFVAALLFTIHPLHTEVIANVKSRDEILSVLFITLTFILAFRYKRTHHIKDIILATVCFFLALLSKEYGITLIVLLPLSFYLFDKDSLPKSIRASLPYLIPVGIYLLLRISSITAPAEGADKDVLNNPYVYATGLQKAASEILVLLDYLKLLVWPHPLSADYSYNQIPYSDLSNPLVWLSLIIYAGMAAAMYFLYVKRHILCFAIAFYLTNLALISNIFFNIGAPLGERLIYHSSIGFCIVVGWLLCKGAEQIKSRPVAWGGLAIVLLILTVVCSFTTIARNKDWKNDETLFLTDVKKVPNSVLANNNAAAACMYYAKQTPDPAQRKEWFVKAVAYFDKALAIYPEHRISYLNRGLCYFDMGNADKALSDWDTVRKYSGELPHLTKYLGVAAKYYMGKGINYVRIHQNDSAIIAFTKGTEAAPELAETWLNLAKGYYMKGDLTSAQTAMQKALQIAPDNKDIKMLQQAILQNKH